MTIYWTTPTGYGYSESEEAVPEIATVITEDQYNQIIAAQNAEQQAAQEQALANAHARWTTVYDGLTAVGVSDAAATALANVVGISPQG